MLWFVFFISCRELEHNAFSFDTLKVLLFFQMSLQDAMQRRCQEAIQGIFKTGPFTIVFFFFFFFLMLGQQGNSALLKRRFYLMQGKYAQAGPRRRTYVERTDWHGPLPWWLDSLSTPAVSTVPWPCKC